MLFGHLAISALQHRYLKADLVPVVVAGVLPDVVDKTLCQVLHLTPSGRMFGHTLAGLGLSALCVTPAGWSRGCILLWGMISRHTPMGCWRSCARRWRTRQPWHWSWRFRPGQYLR